ncbi:BatD family protein [Haloferula chungangensis]|uniref:BatD family protein n=1 Tax=Haloferula chungangensis TaxID=1048331 RepID=A0ABW2L3W3_9BACT
MLRSLIALVMLALCTLQAAEVSAELSDNSVEAGQGVMLTIVVEGGSPENNPSFPKVKNLIINQRGKSNQMRIVNGKMSRSVSFTYVVGSMEAGEYEIPPATVKVDGEEYRTESFKLNVRPGANGAPAGMGEKEDTAETEAEAGDFGYLTFQLATKERDHVYPGEIAPVRIRAFFPMETQVSLNSPPRPEGSAFTLHNLTEEPQQSTEVVNGKRYRVVTWFGGLSATKAGKYPASFGLEARVGIRDQSARRRRSMLDDFFAPMIQKDVVLSTENPPELDVVELPKAGRPDDFTGAIGKFEFESVSLPGALEVGEPVRVQAVLKGQGNFSLLKEPHPLPAENWKVYDGTSEFSAGDVAAFAGSKRFQFNTVPLVPGEGQLSFGFSYFNPEKGEYQSAVSDPQTVSITGELAKPAEAAEVKEAEKVESEDPKLAPLRTDLGRVQSYVPIEDRGWFLPLLGGSMVLTLGIFGYGAWARRAVDHEKLTRMANEAAIRDAMAAAERAIHGGDELAFFMAARDAIRIRVAERTGIRPEAVTSADLENLDDDELMEILKEADRIDYSGRSDAAGELREWKARLDRGLEKLLEEGRRKAA